MSQRDFAIKYAAGNLDTANKDLYEFGVYSGGSSVSLRQNIDKLKMPCNNAYCFDTFVGLPGGEDGTWTEFKEGDYSSVEYFGVDNVDQAIKAFKEKIDFSPVKTYFIPGLFKNSLNKYLLTKYKFKPAFYIDVDVDLYSSTIECLEFMFENGLVEVGTMIGYDDWGATEEYAGGESKAHVDTMKKYNVVAEQIYNCGNIHTRPHIQKVFIIK